MEWMILPLKRYAQFTGRSRRKEFWMWILFIAIAGLVLGLIDSALGLGGGAGTVSRTGAGGFYYGAGVHGGILTDIFSLAILLPNLAVAVRRLHDTDRSGWWILLPVVPYVAGTALIFVSIAAASTSAILIGGILAFVAFICAIVLLVWYCTAGTIGPNRFGEDPKGNFPADLAATFE